MPTRATPDATARHVARLAERFGPHAVRPLGSTGLSVSAVGVSACRFDDERTEHVEAMTAALREGINLVVASVTSGDGAAERCVGAAIQASGVPRDAVVIVASAGPVRGRALTRAIEREQEGRGFEGLVTLPDGSRHGLHPAYLAHAMKASRRRLGVDALDGLLLQDDEALDPLTFGRGAFAACDALEEHCAVGTLGWYGTSSPRLTGFIGSQVPPHLRLLHAPVEALAILDEDRGRAVLASCPLERTRDDLTVRLRDWPPRAPGVTLSKAAERVSDLEAEFARDIAPALDSGSGPPELLSWGRELPAHAARFTDALHWRHVETELVRPRLEHALHHVGLHLIGRVRNDWAAWVPRYREAIETLLGAVADSVAADLPDWALQDVAPEEGRGLAARALRSALRRRGIASVLVGMREAAWVEEALGALQGAWDPPGAIRP